ncbi:hypothetical protein BOTBODRAFT_133638, partial [Botryobasidium botryosum FD-172 SS1]
MDSEATWNSRSPPGRHTRRRISQFARWSDIVIPSLLQPFLDFQKATLSGRVELPNPPPLTTCTCGKGHTIQVTLVHWDKFENTTLHVCECNPATTQLVARGFFPCAPLRPSMAFRLNLLELITLQGRNGAPNITAWAETLVQFLGKRRFLVPFQDSLRRRLANAVHWYQVLDCRAQAIVTDAIAEASDMPLDSTPTHEPTPTAQAAPDAATTTSGSIPALPGADVTNQDPRSPSADAVPPSAPSRSDAPPQTSGPGVRTRPSAYLRGCCPLCFGGNRANLLHSLFVTLQSFADVLACLDANFQQKRRMCPHDAEFNTPNTRFISPEAVQAMAAKVEEARATPPPAPSKSKGKGKATKSDLGLRVPESILNDCEQTFLAAQEKVTKVSKNFYADTGLMALLCRHDRVLWLANITTPGERQHYALALIDEFFRHLPPDWNVGLLYDVACHLERSVEKWNFLPDISDRISWAVSVFHAYGHQWACQLVYHPRKCKGFGLSDGEGCERFWSSIRGLIASLRVSGHYRRLFVLNTQVMHLQMASNHRLGLWLARRYRATQKRFDGASTRFEKCGIGEDDLRAQWELQIETQLKKSPRQSKNAADKAIADVLADREKTKEITSEIIELRRDQLAAQMENELQHDQFQADIDMLEHALTQTKARLKTMEKALGVGGREQLKRLIGNPYLRARMNARALKARLRSKVIDYKFQRTQLERAYRNQILQEKDHVQTKASIHRSEKGIAAIINKYNTLVEEMASLQRARRASKKTVLPRLVDAKTIFRLDVDELLWQEDPGLGEEDCEELPRWLGDDNVREGIIAMLERDRCREEGERLDTECAAMQQWLADELRAIQCAFGRAGADTALAYQLQGRMDDLRELNRSWAHSLSKM